MSTEPEPDAVVSDDAGSKAPVVNRCPNTYYFHTCTHEVGHWQDHSCKHGCWRRNEEKPDVPSK